MSEDHRRAKILAETVAEHPDFEIDLDTIESNIVIFDTKKEPAVDVLKKFEDQGVAMIPFGPNTIRATFHFQVDEQDLEKVLEVVRNYKE
jgi:threonine aldolase